MPFNYDKSRRDILKLFGAGAIISPVAASEVTAKLIEPPKVEIIEPEPLITRPFIVDDVIDANVTFTMSDGTRRSMAVRASQCGPVYNGERQPIVNAAVRIQIGQYTSSSPSWLIVKREIDLEGTL